MNKEKKKMMVPKLRFAEFKDSVDWNEKILAKICTNVSSGKDKSDDNGTYNLYGSTGVIGKTFSDTYEGKYILVARVGANAGLLNMANGKFGVTDNTLVIILNDTENIEFLYYLLDNIGLNKMVFGSGQPLITGGQLKALKLNTPPPKEQQKIATFLTALDDLIAAQSQKIKALQTHKKGLMQQLFPAEGEMVPSVRFREFEGTGEWKYLHGDKVFKQLSDKDHNSDLPILAITQDQGAIPRSEIDYNVIVTDKSIESYKIVDNGDFIISLRSFQGGIEYSNYRGICSPAYVILRKKIDIESHFFKYYFKTWHFIQSLNKNIEGIRDGKMVSFKQFSELLLPTPTKEEQQKIFVCLSSLDDLITAQIQKLEALKAQKKGLMQQLFPNPNDTAL